MDFNRKQFLKLVASAGVLLAFTPEYILSAGGISKILELIKKIGNTNDEKKRAEYIFKALNAPSNSVHEKEILENIFFVADHWANGFENYANPGSEGNEAKGYLCSFFLFKSKIDRFLLPQVDEENPFFPIISFYRSRMLIAQMIQNGKISGVPENRDAYLNESKRLMEFAYKTFPENNLAKNYLGEYEPWEELVEPNPKAPDWANYQRMVLEKLTWLIYWWVDNRQISDGQFGGGWGDDVEMWRKWMPVLFAFEDEKAIASQEKLFEGLYGLSRMKKGYTEFLNDVEHTSEEYSDPIFCMLNMQPENPVWEQRALKVLDYIENIWTGINEQGQLQFKSSWFNVDKIHEDEKRACDTPYHSRLVQPLLLIWLRTGNERVGRFITAWLKTWVKATFETAKGKPIGIVPAAIHWPDGLPAGMGEKWWHPGNYHTKLYDYPSQQSTMYECFLQAYFQTKDEEFLKPLQFVADQRLQRIGDGEIKDYEIGSLEWCLAHLKKSIAGILVKYKLVTGDASYDEIINKDIGGYERFLIDKNMENITQSMASLKKSLSLPVEFYTSEVRWTDRLFAFGKYFNYVLDESLPNFSPNFLFSTLSGSIGNVKVLPMFGVKWLTPPTKIAIFAEVNKTDKFVAQLFHFGDYPRKMKVRFLNLFPGKYKFELEGNRTVNVEITPENRDVAFTLPSQRLVKMILNK